MSSYKQQRLPLLWELEVLMRDLQLVEHGPKHLMT